MRSRAKSVSDRDKDVSSEESPTKRLCFGRNGESSNAKDTRNSKRKPLVLFNTTDAPAKSVQKKNPSPEFDNSKLMSEVVASNCKLSNTLIDLTKKLVDKQSDYEKLIAQYSAKKKEKWSLQQKLFNRETRIAELQGTLKQLIDAKFCDDLIQIDESATVGGKSTNLDENFSQNQPTVDKSSPLTGTVDNVSIILDLPIPDAVESGNTNAESPTLAGVKQLVSVASDETDEPDTATATETPTTLAENFSENQPTDDKSSPPTENASNGTMSIAFGHSSRSKGEKPSSETQSFSDSMVLNSNGPQLTNRFIECRFH